MAQVTADMKSQRFKARTYVKAHTFSGHRVAHASKLSTGQIKAGGL